jgi:hypothetical protein
MILRFVIVESLLIGDLCSSIVAGATSVSQSRIANPKSTTITNQRSAIQQ